MIITKERQLILNDYLNSIPEMEFDWVSNNCTHLIGNYLRLLTGKDYLSKYKYKSVKEFKRILEREGGLIKIIERDYGNKIHVAYAKRGDIVVIQDTCGIVRGKKSVFISSEGAKLADTLKMESAFRVFD